MEEKRIGSEQSIKGKIAGEEKKASGPEAIAPEMDLASDLARVTKQGGLDAVPGNFENKTGYWKTILSDDPFEVLYLDYRLHHLITPDIVQKNYEVLSAFWKEKIILLNSGNREKIKSRYGEDTVNDSLKKLTAAEQKIRTAEGIGLYYKNLDAKRYQSGIKAIEDYIDTVLAGEQLFKEQADKIIAKGIQNGLTNEEVRNHLHEVLVKKQLKPRATGKYEDLFEGKWMTDSQWKITQARATDWLGTTVSTLEEVGEVTFYNKEKAYSFIANSNYLPVVVTQLTNANNGFEFEEIIRKEADMDRRYLKVMYHLNPYLPFRIGRHAFTNVAQVFEMTAVDHNLFLEAASSYQHGHMHIWLNKSDPVNAENLTTGLDFNSFLVFVYRVSNRHPFYLKEERFSSPEELTRKASHDVSIWSSIAAAISNNQIPIWLAGTGKVLWVEQHKGTFKKIVESGFHQENDLNMASVQTLIRVVDPSLPFPAIEPVEKKVELLHVEGSHRLNHSIRLKLTTGGFVKAVVKFEKIIEGINLNEQQVTLHSQQGIKEKEILLSIDALRLIKNKTYSTKILVSSVYEAVIIPVEVRVVFPKKAFFIQLIKYAAIMAVLFGGGRFLLGELTGFKTWLGTTFQAAGYAPLETPEAYLPDDYFMFFVVFMLLLAGLISSFFLIRKFEKI